MKTIIKSYFASCIGLIVLSNIACTKLDVTVRDPNSIAPSSTGGAPTPSSLSKIYEQLNQLVGQYGWHAMQEHSTDELMGPTRGTDWDDFGTWRKLHLHTWDGSHNQIKDVWNGLNGALFQSTLLAETASGQAQAEAKFLRAYFSYIVCDLYGQVQHRPATAAANVIPDIFSRSEAVDFVISELESIIPTLPAFTRDKRNVATKEAAQFLLAKAYLNKAVFKQDPTKPAGPFTFNPADMNKVISLVNSIAANSALSIDDYYWDNFTWDNGTKSTENIFVRQNSGGINMRWATSMGWHYNQTPSSWNGFTTLADFYNSFDDADVRKKSAIPGYTDKVGANAGFLIGQIKGPSGGKIGDPIVDLKDRSGNPLIFTPDASLYFSTETKESEPTNIPWTPSSINDGAWGSANEFAFFRFADARLMKAEAILRGGTDAETPLGIVNSVRTKRGVAGVGSVDLKALLAERGRELYLEAWRRNDMIRFEKFNDPVMERPTKSDGYKVVFPVPNIALSSNPNLKQNFGY